MELIREFRQVDSDEIVIKVPESFKQQQVEILVFPLNQSEQKETDENIPKVLNLSTYKCLGKKRDFARSDAYNDTI